MSTSRAPRRRVNRPSLNRFDLYEHAVQAPALQARFARAVHGGSPRALCEDFCGPAAIARAWVTMNERHRGLGVDRDRAPLDHASRRMREIAPGAARRLVLDRTDVLATRARADIILAFNFGVCEIHERARLVRYLRRARSRLRAAGVFIADLYSGPGAWRPGVSRRAIRSPLGRIVYEWEQRTADPLTGHVVNAMHFSLPGRRRLRDAFVYDWRLWSIPDLRDAMMEAGFRGTEVHLSYGRAIDGHGDPLVEAASAEEVPAGDFVAYITGRTG